MKKKMVIEIFEKRINSLRRSIASHDKDDAHGKIFKGTLDLNMILLMLFDRNNALLTTNKNGWTNDKEI